MGHVAIGTLFTRGLSGAHRCWCSCCPGIGDILTLFPYLYRDHGLDVTKNNSIKR